LETCHLAGNALLPGAGIIAVALAALVGLRAPRPSLWRVVGGGALAWAAAVALQLGWSLVMDHRVAALLGRLLGARAGTAAGWIYLGLLAGAFECGTAWIVVEHSELRRADFRRALALGVGFGAAEALVLAAVKLGTLLPLVAAAPGTSGLLEGIRHAGTLLVADSLERGAALLGHLLGVVLIVYGARRREAGWFWLAFFLKSALDAWSAWLQAAFPPGGPAAEALPMLAMLSALGATCLVGLWVMATRRGWHAPPREAPLDELGIEVPAAR
jgi:hypothetical protein